MAKKTGRYRVLRDFADHRAGDLIDLPDDEAALLIRDGMVAPNEEGGS
jgi:hypothetical protein